MKHMQITMKKFVDNNKQDIKQYHMKICRNM